LLSGCSFESDGKKTPTAVSTAAPPPGATASAIAGLNPATSQSITDGICTTLIPDDWASSGNGRGFTPSGARFILFGNMLENDAEWTAAENIIATVAAGQHAKPQTSADSITYLSDDGTSYEVRKRIDNRYCDFSVTASSPVSDDEHAVWVAVGASMAGASEATATQ
jgi:hypothetical protein